MELHGVSPPNRQPSTFIERGVSWPGTTQLLAGTRVRRGLQGLEFLMPNPSGGRGVYVLFWDAVRDLARPTLHDVLLRSALQNAETITPATVRAAARQVLLDGAAGRDAQKAAVRAQGNDAEARRTALRIIISRLDGRGLNEADLGSLAESLKSVGVGSAATQARVPMLLAQLAALHDGVQAWASRNGDYGGVATMIQAAADLAIHGGATVLTEARAQIQDMNALLAAWHAAPGKPDLAINRPDWFLDGWDVPCLLWQRAESLQDQKEAVAEVCHLLPVLPVEAGRWLGVPIAPPGPAETPRTVGANTDWRTGLASLDKTQRNEHLRALAA